MGKKQQVRAAFRNAVFQRDSYTCQVCGRRWLLEDSDPAQGLMNAHHITDRSLMPNGGYVKENGVTVCDGEGSCHLRCEQYHITGGDFVDPECHPDVLYSKIGSSHEAAVSASEKLA